MKRFGLAMALLLGAQLAATCAARANPVACKQQCIAEHQSRARICTGRACMIDSANEFNACNKKCDQFGKLH
jgi:hypothetical protein